jgi:hypothetical protein
VTHSVDNLNFCDNVILLASGGTHRLCRSIIDSGSPHLVRAIGQKYLECSRVQMPSFYLLRRDQVSFSYNSSCTGENQEAILAQATGHVERPDTYKSSHQISITWTLGCYSSFNWCNLLRNRWRLGLGPGLPNKIGVYLNPIARSTLMILILGTVFIGLSTAIQEIIKENPIRLREKSVGIRSGTYLMSKVLVLGVITTCKP